MQAVNTHSLAFAFSAMSTGSERFAARHDNDQQHPRPESMLNAAAQLVRERGLEALENGSELFVGGFVYQVRLIGALLEITRQNGSELERTRFALEDLIQSID